MRKFLVQHSIGVFAQIAAALPLLLITVILSRVLGLEFAGHFTVAAGLSAFAYSLANWGLRTHIVVDQLKSFSVAEYLLARSLGIVVAGAVTLAACGSVGVPVELIVIVIFLRTSDAIIDLNLAFDQVLCTSAAALKRFGRAHGAKLLALIILGTAGYAVGPERIGLLIVAIGALIAATAAITTSVRYRKLLWGPLVLSKIWAIFFQSKWFATAEIGASGITSAPRISLAWLYGGENLGVAGTSLSIAGFFGMAFYTSWLRFFPQFNTTARKTEAVSSFVLENAGVAILLSVAAWFILPSVTALVFGFGLQEQLQLSRDTLLACVVFFAGMNLVNLYKISLFPWLESIAYVVAIAVTVIGASSVPTLRTLPNALIIAGITMAAFSSPNVVRLLWTPRPNVEGKPPLAVFVRIGSRPIPRVVRMMQVASEVGYECVFLGASREEGLPRVDVWQRWPVKRIGPTFGLLNGTRPFTYAISIMRFNFALYRVLRSTRPALIHSSDCETMPAAILYRMTHKSRLIFNIHDNLAQRYNVPRPVAAALNSIEGIFVRCSDVATVPERFRKTALPTWCQRKVVVIRNTPIDPGVSEPTPRRERIRIFYGGWLDWGRGLRQLLEMAAITPQIELRVAGEGAPTIVKELERNTNLVFLGFLDHDRVMSETEQCHFVAAFYDPGRVINRFAASNKIAEAFAVGRPILMNNELEIAKDLMTRGCTISLPYSEIGQWGDRIVAFVNDWNKYRTACANARAVYDSSYAWKSIRQTIVQVLADTSP